MVNLGLDARVEILSRLRGVPPQLPAALAPRAGVGSHLQNRTFIQLRIQVRLAQLNSFRGRHLPPRKERLSDRLRQWQLFVLCSALEEVESVPTGGGARLLSGNDRVEEDVVEVSNLTFQMMLSEVEKTRAEGTASVPSSM